MLANPGLVLNTMRHGSFVGEDATGNRYYQENKPDRPGGRKRRWVIFANRAREASLVPPEWHAWLHFTTDQPLPEHVRQPWQRPYLPNQTGSAGAYRPSGHDYAGGVRARASGDYEAWTPDA
ncbi:MAG TPA: NADH:ubiquinone oxidoreductase subunit NDUFA12 [Acidiphilium sp.]